jgi:hypothetical protein
MAGDWNCKPSERVTLKDGRILDTLSERARSDFEARRINAEASVVDVRDGIIAEGSWTVANLISARFALWCRALDREGNVAKKSCSLGAGLFKPAEEIQAVLFDVQEVARGPNAPPSAGGQSSTQRQFRTRLRNTRGKRA